MLSLRDIHHEPYYNEDGTINPECRLFAGWKQDKIDKYIPKDIFHVPAYIDGIYNPDCLLTEYQAQYMLQLKQKSI